MKVYALFRGWVVIFKEDGVGVMLRTFRYLWDISLSKCAEWAKEISKGGRPGRFLDSGFFMDTLVAWW